MYPADPQLINSIYQQAKEIEVVDCHTHIQDDITDFSKLNNIDLLRGTQASFNSTPDHLIEKAQQENYLVRQLMLDATHGLSYSWFMQIAEGASGRSDSIIEQIEKHNDRHTAGRMLIEDLQNSSLTEYADWLRAMFHIYQPDFTGDILAPENFDSLTRALDSHRNDPALAPSILQKHHIKGYVTSIENKDLSILDSHTISPHHLNQRSHSNCYHMIDLMYLTWPQGATDFGHYLQGHKYQAEQYLLNLEKMLQAPITSIHQLRSAIESFLWKTLWSPKTNPESLIRFSDIFLPLGENLNRPYSKPEVINAIRFSKSHLEPEALHHLTAFVTEVMLETLNQIGKEIKDAGNEYGSCLQIAHGVRYFMDRTRELQSFSAHHEKLSHTSFPIWTAYPHIHFEYIIADETIYREMICASKQTANVSVGPWWHLFRKNKMAELFYEQLLTAPLNSIASGFTDARFVEMLIAKYDSLRFAISSALASIISDPSSSHHRNETIITPTLQKLLHHIPAKKHHLTDWQP